MRLILTSFVPRCLIAALCTVGLRAQASQVVRSPFAALMGASTTIFDIAISPSFVVLPLFMLMGAFVTQARLSDDLYDAAHAWLGHFRGGLAMSTVAASGGFAAVSGNSVATVVTMACMIPPESSSI